MLDPTVIILAVANVVLLVLYGLQSQRVAKLRKQNLSLTISSNYAHAELLKCFADSKALRAKVKRMTERPRLKSGQFAGKEVAGFEDAD